MARLLVRGAGDVGSAVAHRLRSAGHVVVLHDEPLPAYARRGMAFTDAFFDKVAYLGGVLAKRATGAERLERMLACANALPVTDEAFERVLDVMKPEVIVDARMRKHDVADDQRALAPVVVGLGPGFVVGANAHLVVETAWGDELGKVINEGGARELAGDPRPVGGHGRDRYVHAPASGALHTAHAIGDVVRAGIPRPPSESASAPAGSPMAWARRSPPSCMAGDSVPDRSGIAHRGCTTRLRSSTMSTSWKH